ncbi:MAG: type II secretion system protein GspE [Gammaproteobacteria bacterium]|nr:type II secretion system protein GspE [Gammaproteobacteria bacterium]
MPQILRERSSSIAELLPPETLVSSSDVSKLEESIQACIKNRQNRIDIDFENVSFIGSAALELLMSSHESLYGNGGGIRIVNVSSMNMDVFRISGLLSKLNISSLDEQNVAYFHSVSSDSGPRRRLGEMLVEAGLTTEDKVQQALQLQSQTGRRMGQILVSRGWVSENDMLEVLSHQLHLPFVMLKNGLFDQNLVSLIEKSMAQRLKVLPLFRLGNELMLATSDPQAIPSFDEIERVTRCTVRPVLVQTREIEECIDSMYSGNTSLDEFNTRPDEDFEVVDQLVQDDLEAIDELAAGSPVVNLVNAIIQRAIRDGGSDVHIEPGRQQSRVRLRIDGVLYEIMTPASEMHPALVSRLKVMANLDIAERRLPQDGRIQVSTSGRVVDLRFSSLPGIFGEKVVLRVLDKNQSILDIDKIGLADVVKKEFQELLHRSHGLILVTGPTGSGKTTSLYAAINYLNSSEKSIVTIEDPVEYQIDIINQNQVKESTGLTFARLLRHVLRQDPDTVMVGEIRDHETAEIAVQAALTGHLVLSTLHTNDAVGAITRLLDMGIKPYLLSSALIGVVAQRLIRKVCTECKTSFIATPDILQQFGWQEDKRLRLTKGRGCPYCYDSGYKGRIGIHELISPDAELQKLMIMNPSRDQLAEYIEQSQLRTLFDDGIERVREGSTTIEEIERITAFA